MKVLRYLDLDDVIFDPDENSSAVWELWMFCLTIALYLKVLGDITAGVDGSNVVSSEIVAVIFEIFFALDFYFHSRLGYYEYGNKIMDIVAIRKRFFRSHHFYCAALGLFPLYVVNWMLGSAHRYEFLSANKLLRLVGAPATFAKLESKHLNRTLQLRLVKLVIVSLILSHLFGCIWLNFKGSQNAWMPSPSLKTADPGRQYSALLFWSFGIMSHSNSGELPTSLEQCFFAVVVLLVGAFLFAFVIGNISDVVELVDADSRDFNTKLSSLRLLLGHFHLPFAIEEQLKLRLLILQGTALCISRYDSLANKFEEEVWVDMLLQCTDAQSAFHIQWLKIIAASTIYMALAIPYRNSFDALGRLGPLPIAERVIELTCEVLFGWDIWVHWNLKDGLESMELYESKQRDAYQKERLWIDILAAIPIDHFLSDFYQSPLLCMNRCLKLFNFPHYMKEINRRSVAYEKNRFWTLWVLFFVLMHWCACAYFSLASVTRASDTVEGETDWDNWAPPRSAMNISWADPSMDMLMLRFLRGLFFASTAFIKKGKVRA
ncbi:hypothetical protein PR003_g4184 [Phytophthora rubi]|nr:hypothetical protein PR003_g4184 [Phytophthora rubi]